jgi:hypothetical protein
LVRTKSNRRAGVADFPASLGRIVESAAGARNAAERSVAESKSKNRLLEYNPRPPLKIRSMMPIRLIFICRFGIRLMIVMIAERQADT